MTSEVKLILLIKFELCGCKKQPRVRKYRIQVADTHTNNSGENKTAFGGFSISLKNVKNRTFKSLGR
jgi:hypothetical protein